MNSHKLSHLAAAAAVCLISTQALLSTQALAQKKYDTGASDTEIKIGNVEAYSDLLPPTASSARPRKPISSMINDAGGINRPQDQLDLLR